MSNEFDVIIVGGGTVGLSIGYGLSRLGKKTIIFDEDDNGIRAAMGNFGLIWVQGKGINSPEYATWTRKSAELWKTLNQELLEQTNIDIAYSQPGGFDFCLSVEEFEKRALDMDKMVKSSNSEFESEMYDRELLKKHLPEIGEDVVGASFSKQDGHVNPLLLHRALNKVFKQNGGEIQLSKVQQVKYQKNSFVIESKKQKISAKKIVLAAGLGNLKLAPQLGLNAPVSPQRGQILVTEKSKHFLDYPTSLVRQTAEGSLLLGDSHEDVGYDPGTSSNVMQVIADRARRIFPHLNNTRIVRAWGALRILSKDGLPLYDQSTEYPGAFTASCHSGITLAAVHAMEYAKYVVEGELPKSLEALSEKRFHV